MRRFGKGQVSMLILFSSLPMWMHAQQNQKISISIEKAVEIALNENPTVKIADMEIERVDYSRKEAIGNLFPQVGASFDYSRALKKQVMYMDFDMSALTGGSKPTEVAPEPSMDGGMEVGRDNTWSGGFNFQLPIIAPAMWKNIKLTQADVQQTIEKSRSSRLTLVNEVEKAYYNVLLAEDSYNVLKMSYDNAKTVATDFQNKFNNGKATEYDVLRSQVQIKNIEPSLLQAENGISLAKMQLKVLMGIDVATEVDLTDKLSNHESTMYEETLKINTDLTNNTTLRQLDLQHNYLEKAIMVQKMAYTPTLMMTGMYNWLAMTNDFKFKDYRWNPYSTIGFTLSIPLVQGGSRYFKVKQSQMGVQQLKWQRENVVRNLNMQVKSSMDNIEKSVKQIASNKEGVRQAEKAYTIQQKSFEVGHATIIDLNDADYMLTSSRLAYYQAIFDYLVAKSNLELVLGSQNVETEKK